MTTESILHQQGLDKSDKHDDLDNLSERVTELSNEVGKCASKKDAEKLIIMVTKFIEEVDEYKKQEKFKKHYEVLVNLSEKLDKIAWKEELKEWKRDINKKFFQTNFTIFSCTVFLSLVILAGGLDRLIIKVFELLASIILFLTQ